MLNLQYIKYIYYVCMYVCVYIYRERYRYILHVCFAVEGGGGVLLDHSCMSNPQTLISTVKRGMITTTIITMCDA